MLKLFLSVDHFFDGLGAINYKKVNIILSQF